MKKILLGLMVMGVCAGAMAQTSSMNTAALKGTVDLMVNVWNNGADTNCDAWQSEPLKLDAFLVICFGEVYCPECPIEVIDAQFVLVDKDNKDVWVESLNPGDSADLYMFCLGGTGILMQLGMEMLDNDPDIVMLAKRKDSNITNSTFVTKTQILSAKGAFGQVNDKDEDEIYTTEVPGLVRDWVDICEPESIAVAGTITLSDFKLSVPKQPCATCGDSCSDYLNAFEEYILKKYPESKYSYIDATEESYWDWHYGYILE